jgi:hypothetical membrane protein
VIGLLLCVTVFLGTALVGRRSLVAGICAVITIGYFYGIIRGNVPQTASHFIFDSAVLGLYAVQLFRHSAGRSGSIALRLWVAALCAWPVILLAVPKQDPLIQLVGLRAAILLVPFLLLGARLESRDLDRLAMWCAGLNLVAFAFAVGEYLLGLEPFFPYNAVTALIYKQHDIGGYEWSRIPATFSNAHAYAGTMVVTLPLLFGGWLREHGSRLRRGLLAAAVVAALLGVFMAGARSHTVIAIVLLLVVTLSGRIKIARRITLAGVILLVGWRVSADVRLQRFMSLQDTEYVAERVSWSVRSRIVDAVATRPFGNGLGGGGTNIPYFLQRRLHNPIVMENEYARIALEQGIPGLAIWIAFLIWAFARHASQPGDSWRVGRRLAWVAAASYFGTAWIGLGLLSSIPHATFLLLSTGWIVTPERGAAPVGAGEASIEPGSQPSLLEPETG